MKSVLILGSGATGAAAAAHLRRALAAPALSVHVWDKGRNQGGRMTTSWLDGGSVDTGAAYFTAGPTMSPLFLELIRAGVLRPLPHGADVMVAEDAARAGSATHYIAERGASAVPSHFLAFSGVPVRQSCKAVSLTWQGGRVTAAGEQGDATGGMERVTHAYDAVICTIPSPQVPALLKGASISSPPGVLSALAGAKYCVQHVTSIGWKAGGAGGEAVRSTLPYTMRYVSAGAAGGPADLRFLCVDSRKRGLEGRGGSSATTVVLHSRPYAEGVDPECDAPPDLVAQAQALHPVLHSPDAVRKHRWRYSQVTTPVALGGGPTPPALLCTMEEGGGGGSGQGGHSNSAAPLVLAGDYFTGSNLEGCLASGEAAARLVLRGLGMA